MRTLSVKETAQALGVSVRTVQYRLQNGVLKGMRTINQYGVKEWRVWPNKEILERLGSGKVVEDHDVEHLSEEYPGSGSGAIVDAEAVEHAPETSGSALTPVKVLVRELTRQFAEQLSREKEVILQLQRDLEEKDRQLRFLPDLEKQAEQRRKEAELKELELQALRKQISAMQEEQQAQTEEVERLSKFKNEVLPQLKHRLDEERAQQQEELADYQRQLAGLEQEKREAEESGRKVGELERALVESKQQAEETLNRLREEKAAETRAMQELLQGISTKLAKAQTPWWKKLFGVPPD